MDFKIRDLMLETREPFRRGYWKIMFTSFLMILMSSGVTYSAIIGSINEIPELIKNIFSNELTSIRQENLRVVAVLLTMVGGMLLLYLLVKFLMDIFLENPVEVGADRMLLSAMEKDQPVMLASLAFAFDADYLNTVKIIFQKRLFRDLWSLLLVVPGIIKTYEYMMIPYLLADNPYQTSKEVFEESKKMMKGYKRKAFLLDMYFIPWQILGALTMGVMTVFYVNPKKNLVKAAFYMKIKEQNKGEE